jgi:hypothetical protein
MPRERFQLLISDVWGNLEREKTLVNEPAGFKEEAEDHGYYRLQGVVLLYFIIVNEAQDDVDGEKEMKERNCQISTKIIQVAEYILFRRMFP